MTRGGSNKTEKKWGGKEDEDGRTWRQTDRSVFVYVKKKKKGV